MSKRVEQAIAVLEGVRQTGNGRQALCPAHEDHNASLSISVGVGGKTLLHCQAGCTTENVVKAMSLTMADLTPSPNGQPKKRMVATYDYTDEAHNLLFQVVRYANPKDFRQRKSKPDGGWLWSTKGVRKVLYGLPELVEMPDKLVTIVEGERDVAACRERDILATTNPGGVGKWRPEYSELLRGRRVIVVPDNDPKGIVHAEEVAASLHDVGSAVKVLMLPDLPKKGDISDWFRDGGSREKLGALAKAAPKWEPPSEQPQKDIPTLSNVRREGRLIVPVPMAELVKSILDRTGNWPRRVEDSLFYDDGEQGVRWFGNASSLFGWLAGRCGVLDWHRVNGACPQEHVFHEIRREAHRYEAIEEFPHHPKIDGHYYTCQFPEPGDGQALETLLNYFSPETDLDRQLLTAAMVTPLWGGLPGTRPSFMFTATAGRGKGKTKAAEFVARLYGGVLTVSPSEDINTIKTRLLSPEALSKRCALCDNVKTPRFSWADLEALITCDTINGKRLYVGDASRPNYVTWMITLNGASLSTDMAQRTVEIKLGEPSYSGNWEEAVGAFIDTNHSAILADLVAFLQGPQKPLSGHSRWGAWENAILTRFDAPNACAALIAERRAAVDAEQEEGGLIHDFFTGRLRSLEYDPDTSDVFIPSSIAAEWYNLAMGSKSKTTAVTRAMKQLHDEGRLWCLVPARDGHDGSRGFRWAGKHTDASTPIDYELRKRLAKAIAKAKQQPNDPW